jgi:hypothetical protein
MQVLPLSALSAGSLFFCGTRDMSAARAEAILLSSTTIVVKADCLPGGEIRREQLGDGPTLPSR